MARATKTYRRLPGRSKKYFGLFTGERYRLWLADDHVLHVCNRGYSERSKRFYLKDIQALTISETSAGKTVTGFLAAGTATLGLVALGAFTWWEWSPWAGGFWAVMAGISLAPLLTNLILGPTCKCHLHTAVQVEDLAGLRRLRTAHKTVGILKPLIEAAQGRLTPEELEVDSAERTEVKASAHAIPAGAAVSQAPRVALRHESGQFHAALFCMLLVGAVSSWGDIYYQHVFKNLVDLVCFAVTITLAVIALRRQTHSDLPPELIFITWIALAVLIGHFVLEQFFVTVYHFIHPELWEDLFSLQTHYEGPGFVGFCAIVVIAKTVVGCLGFMRLHAFRVAYAARIAHANVSAESAAGSAPAEDGLTGSEL